ncbi:MAG: ACT domain-containing protein [Planctomycetes bacterium]|nr:ACT domain-containing protein [Planctomycetota bacterium]
MPKRYIITLTAANRVGVLAAVGTALDELGANIHELSQTVMQKFFSIILAADFPENREPQVILDHLRDACRPFGGEVCLKDPDAEELREDREGDYRTYYLTVEGKDRPGVMRRISSRLAERQIDIVDLYGLRDDDSQTFHAAMGLAVPAAVEIAPLQKDLKQLGDSLGLAIRLYNEQEALSLQEPRLLRLQSVAIRKQLTCSENDDLGS